MRSFGEILKQIRLEKNMSQDELAALLKTTKQVISRYEKGQRSPKVSVVAEYAEVLNIPLCVLLGEASPLGSAPVAPSVLLNPQEEELVAIYRDLNTEGQDILMGTARGLAMNPDMKKDGGSSTETA